MPMLMFDVGFYIREEKGGLLIGGGDSSTEKDRQVDQDHPPTAERIPKTQVNRIREHIRHVENVMPVLKNAEIDKIGGGIPTYTADGAFIADAVPNHSGLFVLTGCQEAGMTHGPGLGKMMAELVTKGETSWDQTLYRLTRFVS